VIRVSTKLKRIPEWTEREFKETDEGYKDENVGNERQLVHHTQTNKCNRAQKQN
jgi:hypothetical protein